MEIPQKTLINGFSMPVFGIGTWQMGGRHDRNTTNDATDIAAIRAAIDMGVTHIDTAEVYASGHAEELVGKAIRGYDRSKLFIASKVFADHMEHDALINACTASLARVGTDYFDLYILHRHVPNVLLSETMAAMDELKNRELIRNLGVSNFNTAALEESRRCATNPIVYNQVHYNLEFREPEREGLLDYCQKNDVFLAAWRPLEKGALLADAPQVLIEMCDKYKKTPAQIAINWLISQKNVVTLAKSSNIDHLKENLGAIEWEMDTEDIERLRLEFPDQKDISDAVPLA
ncbi:MAG: Uncharacterized protein G01um10148_495 [Parcubacteria group bacterium Gr01-1014_8]|nr:MAG: Uncharacterized protein G01um10148_495 [Parcubacteria group bacterium Gr01-1014_8]